MTTKLDRRPPASAPEARGFRKAILLVERGTKEAIWDCRMCGQCILQSTGLSCPMRCPKSLRNGPCGGALQNGNCEVLPDQPCVWVQAWDGARRRPGGSRAVSGEPPRSHLHRLLASGAFVVTAELQATDSPDPESVYRLADLLRGSVDAVNCTDNSAAHPHISPLASAHLLLDRGVEPIVQLACRDRNRLALQADLLGAVALGARNVCLMTGDDVTAGDHPEAKPIYDIDAVHAIHIARGMRDQGVYVSGRNLDQPLPLFIGAVENPFAPPRDFRPIRLGKKVEAGAEFVQTQIVF